jgi:predicted TPR repeat methyltransferase
VYGQVWFEQSYFEESYCSNYLKYTDRCYDKLAVALASECSMKTKDVIVDYGCATGTLISSLKKLGFKKLTGTDISYWAIEYGKRQFHLTKELQHYNRNLLLAPKDWLIVLDVLEHMPTRKELRLTFKLIQTSIIRKGLIVRVPVSAKEKEDFYFEESRKDKTHFQKHCKKWWLKFFASFDFYPLKYFASEPQIWDSTGVLAVLLGRPNQGRRKE